jgi:hypothetical protein
MATRPIVARVPESLEARARSAAPELAGLDVSTLVRAALAMLADPGAGLSAALRVAEDSRQPPGPRRGAART